MSEIRQNLETYTLTELRKMAREFNKEMKIPNASKLKKSELLDAMTDELHIELFKGIPPKKAKRKKGVYTEEEMKKHLKFKLARLKRVREGTELSVRQRDLDKKIEETREKIKQMRKPKSKMS